MVDATWIVVGCLTLSVVLLLIVGCVLVVAVWMAGKWVRESNRIQSEACLRGIEAERKQLQTEIRMVSEDGMRREARLVDAIVEMSRGQLRRVPLPGWEPEGNPVQVIESLPPERDPIFGEMGQVRGMKYPVAPSTSKESPGLKLHDPVYHDQLSAFGDLGGAPGVMNGTAPAAV